MKKKQQKTSNNVHPSVSLFSLYIIGEHAGWGTYNMDMVNVIILFHNLLRITKTCLYNIDPLKPNFSLAKGLVIYIYIFWLG